MSIDPKNLTSDHMDVIWCIAGLERLKNNGVIEGELLYEIADKSVLAEVVACEYTPTKENLICVLQSLGGCEAGTDLEVVAEAMLSGAGEEIKEWTP